MTQQMETIARYQQLRRLGLPLNQRLTETLTKTEIDEGGRNLGILKGNQLVLGNEDEIVILMDFCLHDIWQHGQNAIERFFAKSPPPPDSDEMLILQGKRTARYSLFMVEALVPGFGVHVRDLLYEEALFLTDVGFSNSAKVGLVIAFRLTTVDGINMTTGAALPVGVISSWDRAMLERDFVSRFKKMVSPSDAPEEKSAFVAALIRGCLQKGASSHIRYSEEEAPKPKRRAAPPNAATRVIAAKKKVVGLNDRCPCGSGRKLKNCCGSQHAR